jgi:riboflavin synthase alpha subunit
MPHIGISEFAVMLAFALGDSLAVEGLEACFTLAGIAKMISMLFHVSLENS